MTVRASAAVAGVLLAAALAALAPPQAAWGQAVPARPPLSADRPGLGDRAAVMGQGLWQAETGGTLQADEWDEYLVGSALLRMGFAGVEMRLQVPSAFLMHEGGFLQLGDLGLGVKAPLDLGGAWWSWAVAGAVSLPTGSDPVDATGAEGDATFIGQVELAGDVSLAMNTGYGFPFDDVTSGALTLVATPSFPLPGNGGLRGYLGFAASVRSGDDTFFLDWGLTRMDGADRQWDLNAGYDPGSHHWFLGIGLVQRGGW